MWTATALPADDATPTPTPTPTDTTTAVASPPPVLLDPGQYEGIGAGLVLIVMLLAAILAAQLRRP